jgi:hypothetical protein
MARIFITALLLGYLLAPAFAGDDNPGKHKGWDNNKHGDESSAAIDDGNNGNDSPGTGLQWTARGTANGSPPPNSNSDLEYGGAGTYSAPGQD